jgi:tetratricopeptide (TPR) repeat protein
VLDKEPNTRVFWVHAETEARFAHSYREIAEMIKMRDWDNPTANVVQLVNAWLCNDATEPWLLIVDSADDANVLLDDVPASGSSAQSPGRRTKLPFASILSSSHTGSILVTTRNREVASLVADPGKDIIELGPMDDDEAFALLRKKFNSTVKSDDAMSLIRALDNIPLALTQAAAFINRTPRMSISRYLEALDGNRVRVLEDGQVDIRRDREASNSTTMTWQLSFDYIRKRCPGAARLLSLMCFFDRRDIPRSILEGNYAEEHQYGQSNFETDLYMLTSFCLVKPSPDGTAFEMHRLVQHATRDWLDRHGEHLYWKGLIVVLMDKHFPVGYHENLMGCAKLYPHAKAALDNTPQGEDALEAWASLCFKVAWYAADRGDTDKAYGYILDSYDVREILWGADAPLTLDSLNSLALVLHRSGRYVEAKERYQRALQGQVSTLGAQSRDALNTMVNLAGLHNDECHWIEAEALLVEAATGCVDSLGSNHSLTLNAKTLLATTYRSLCRWSEAQELELQLLEVHKSQLGASHPRTLAVMSNLAFTYRKQGRLEAAEQLQLQLLQTYLANPDLEVETLALKSHLANTYKDQGRLSEASSLQSAVLQASQTVLGPSHFDTLTCMSQLSSTYCAQGRYSDALDLETQTLAIREPILGAEHLFTVDSRAILTMAYRGLGRLDEAESLGLQALTSHRRKLGERHSLTLDSKIGLASTLRAQGRLKEASNMECDVARVRGEIRMETRQLQESC